MLRVQLIHVCIATLCMVKPSTYVLHRHTAILRIMLYLIRVQPLAHICYAPQSNHVFLIALKTV